MFKIDGAGHLNNEFVAEDVATGRPPTEVTADWLNAVQAELINVISAAGLALDKTNSAQLLAALRALFVTSPDVGKVSFFARNTAPTGFLKCNGALISRTTYSALFTAIGTTFGAGDGSTTYALPDLRGEFLRVWDDGRGIDSGRGFGTWQEHDIKPHSHTTPMGMPSTLWGANPNVSNGSPALMGHPSTTGTSGNNETRPRNIALLACIKF